MRSTPGERNLNSTREKPGHEHLTDRNSIFDRLGQVIDTKIIKAFLESRQQCVVIGGERSD